MPELGRARGEHEARADRQRATEEQRAQMAGDGEAPDAVDAAADGSDGPPGDGPPGDGPSPDQGGCKWGATGNGNDPCNGVPAETWRCVFTTEFGGTTVSQVCRNNKWVNYNLTPRNCKACCGSYTIACDQ